MRARTPSIVALALAVVALFVWRGVCIAAGPDIDTDAYAHHMIARVLLADPRDLAAHWVWLPLFHYLQMPLIALGGTMNNLRWINNTLTAALPIVLFVYVRRTCRRRPVWTSPDATALLAALFAAACPIAMQMGTTAQSEPLFALLMLGVAIAYQARRSVIASVMLSAAVMLRYEAWSALAAIAAITATDDWRRRRRGIAVADARKHEAWLVVALPLACILGWALLRRPVDGHWFGFLRDTHEFAAGALNSQSAVDRRPWDVARDFLYYPVGVAWRVLGPALPLIPFGVGRTLRQQGARFTIVLAACLAFVSVTWSMHASLGLDRHFVVVIPLYATCAAQGLAAIAEGATKLARKFGGARPAASCGRTLAGALAVLSVGGLCIELDVWMRFWQASIERGWPARRALGSYLRTVPDAPIIFCDDATLEILSAVDRRRFDRRWLDDPRTWEAVADAARAHGVAFVATWKRKLRGYESLGDVVFHAADIEGDPNSEIAVMRVAADPSRAAR